MPRSTAQNRRERFLAYVLVLDRFAIAFIKAGQSGNRSPAAERDNPLLQNIQTRFVAPLTRGTATVTHSQEMLQNK